MLKAQEILELFFYRNNPFAIKTNSGMYVPVHRPITKLDVDKHLQGLHTIGAYNARPDGTCKWACIDFDRLTYSTQAKDIAIRHRGKLEVSESKGYHVWFFFDHPRNVYDVHHWLIQILDEFGLKKGVDSKIDIFPRSDALSGKRISWLVRIPTTNWVTI